MNLQGIALATIMTGLALPLTALAQPGESSLMSELRSLSSTLEKLEDSEEHFVSADDSSTEKCRCPLANPTKDDCPKCTKKSDCPSYGCAIVKLPKTKLGGDQDIETAACEWGKAGRCKCPAGMAELPPNSRYECQASGSVNCSKVKCMIVNSVSGITSDTGKTCEAAGN